MAKLLANVGRDPKTCVAQITAFCRGGVSSVPGGDVTGTDKRQQHRKTRSGGGGDVSDGGEEKSSEARRHGHTDGNVGRARGGSRDVAGEAARDGKKNSMADVGYIAPSTASLAEVIAYFGFVFESSGAAVKPSVAEAFAMLRLHAQPTEVRAAGEAARK